MNQSFFALMIPLTMMGAMIIFSVRANGQRSHREEQCQQHHGVYLIRDAKCLDVREIPLEDK